MGYGIVATSIGAWHDRSLLAPSRFHHVAHNEPQRGYHGCADLFPDDERRGEQAGASVPQDATLLAETTAIKVVIDSQNRLTATTNGQAGAILTSPLPVNDWRTVTLYNAQGKVLYSQEGY